MQSEADTLHFWAALLVKLPSYIPEAWHDRIQIVIDEKGIHYIWTGWSNGEGHGKVKQDGKGVYVHRHIVETVTGRKLGRKEVVDHKCRHRGCINFDCLEPVTVLVNTLRGDGAGYWFKRRNQENEAQDYGQRDPPF